MNSTTTTCKSVGMPSSSYSVEEEGTYKCYLKKNINIVTVQEIRVTNPWCGVQVDARKPVRNREPIVVVRAHTSDRIKLPESYSMKPRGLRLLIKNTDTIAEPTGRLHWHWGKHSSRTPYKMNMPSMPLVQIPTRALSNGSDSELYTAQILDAE